MKAVLNSIRNVIPKPDSDVRLLRNFQVDHDNDAFSEIMKRYGGIVWSVCRRGLPDYSDAEDAYQAVFLVLLRRADRITDETVLSAWLCRTAVWTVRNLRRRNRHRRRQNDTSLDEIPFEPKTSDFELFELLVRLPEKYRVPIVMCHLQGWSRAEVADRLGIPTNTVATRLARGLRKLRKNHGSDPVVALACVVLAAVPASLSARTLETISQFGTNATPHLLNLTQGVLTMFFFKKMIVSFTMVAVVVVSAFGLVMASGQEHTEAKTQTPQSIDPKKPTSTNVSLAEQEVKQAEAELENKKKSLELAKMKLAKLQADAANKSSGPPDRLEFRYYDAGGWSSNFHYAEFVGGKQTIALSFYHDTSTITNFLKRTIRDPLAPKTIVICCDVKADQPSRDHDRDSVAKLVNDILAAGAKKAIFTGYLPYEVTYGVTGTSSEKVRSDGTSGFAMTTKYDYIKIETSKFVIDQEIDLEMAFPEQYRRIRTKTAVK